MNFLLKIFMKPAKQINLIFFSFNKLRDLFSNMLLSPQITLKGMLNFFAKLIPLAPVLLHNIKLTFIGKFGSLEYLIIEFKLDPVPDMNIQVFFFSFLFYFVI